MSNSNRRQYLTSTILDQDFLNQSQDNLECRLEMVCDIETPAVPATYTNPTLNFVEVTASGHPYRTGNYVTIVEADDAGLIGTWEVTSHTLTTFRFNKGSAISPSTGAISYSWTIRASDRNKYVGSTFYEALLNFPVIGRTVGEWLESSLQFSVLNLELSNVDGRFNRFLPAGSNFGGWIGKQVLVKVGLSEQAGTYSTIFKGHITDVGGFKRTTESIVIIARDDYDSVNVTFPKIVFKAADFPKIEDKNVNKIVPVIYGDWTTATEPSPATVPATVLNGRDQVVTFAETAVEISGPTTPALVTGALFFDADDPVVLSTTGALPSPFIAGTTYYIRTPVLGASVTLSVTPGGASIASVTAGSGQHRIAPLTGSARRNVKLRISENDLVLLDNTGIHLKRGDIFTAIPSTEITTIGAGNKTFEILQDTATLWVLENGIAVSYKFEASDEFYVKVRGKDLSGFDDNPVWQARDLLITYGGLLSGDFDANWATFRGKSSPPQSSIATIKSRIWIQEVQTALTYALQILEQVRLEAFVSRDLLFKINSLHFEDFDPSPTFRVKNWDIADHQLKTSTDERNIFNRAQGVFNFLPDRNENGRSTQIYRNDASVTQLGKEISKKVIFPNLYVPQDVQYQLIEILGLASSSLETIDVPMTWRSLLQDIGNFLSLDVQIGSSQFTEVPCMVRDIGYDPNGFQIVFKLWSMQMTPFPGYTPGFFGIVGGYSAVITAE